MPVYSIKLRNIVTEHMHQCDSVISETTALHTSRISHNNHKEGCICSPACKLEDLKLFKFGILKTFSLTKVELEI